MECPGVWERGSGVLCIHRMPRKGIRKRPGNGLHSALARIDWGGESVQRKKLSSKDQLGQEGSPTQIRKDEREQDSKELY